MYKQSTNKGDTAGACSETHGNDAQSENTNTSNQLTKWKQPMKWSRTGSSNQDKEMGRLDAHIRDFHHKSSHVIIS